MFRSAVAAFAVAFASLGPAAVFAPAAVAQATDVDEVVAVDNGATHKMLYLTPQIRTKARGMGFGGVAQYAALPGSKAMLRLSGAPVFRVAIPNNAQPQSVFSVASFAVRKNNTREVVIGGGYMSYSTGISQDRIVPTTLEKSASQARAPKDHTLYDVKPVSQMAPGEYALVLYSSQFRGASYLAAGADSYFDFGVD